MKRFFTYLKTELKLSLRDMNMVIFAIIMPLVIFIILGIIYGTKPAYDGAGYTFMEQSFGAVSAVAICASGLMGLPLAVSGLRELKILKRLRVTPVSPVYRLLCCIPCNAVSCGTFVGSAAAWFASHFPWELGTYHALDSVRRYAGGRRGKGHQAGKRHCFDPLFPHAGLFRHNAADRGHAKGDAKNRQHFPADAGTYDDEKHIFRHQHRKYSVTDLRDAWSCRTLHHSRCSLLPMGIRCYIKPIV